MQSCIPNRSDLRNSKWTLLRDYIFVWLLRSRKPSNKFLKHLSSPMRRDIINFTSFIIFGGINKTKCKFSVLENVKSSSRSQNAV